LASNSQSSCLRFLNAGIAGAYHCTLLKKSSVLKCGKYIPTFLIFVLLQVDKALSAMQLYTSIFNYSLCYTTGNSCHHFMSKVMQLPLANGIGKVAFITQTLVIQGCLELTVKYDL
jgi:hypothetical protein